MARSIQTVVSSGSLVILGVTLDYEERNDITVYFDDVAQLGGWGWVGTTDKTIVFDPAVPAGVTVKLQRRTDVGSMKHAFSSGAQFKAASVDANFKQLLHLVQELTESGVPPSTIGGLDMAGEKIVNLAPGVNGGDAVNKAQMDTAILEGSGAGVVVENVGNFGAGVFKEKFGSTLRLRKIQAGANVTVTEGTDTVTISSSGGGGSGEVNTSSNVGTGVGLANPKVGVDLPFKSLKAGANVSISSTGSEVTISASGGSLGEANTSSNAGTGVGLANPKVGVDLPFKSLKAGANVSISSTGSEVTISATGGGSSTVKVLTEFGAVGDGVTDNTAAFAAAAAWIIANRAPVLIPPGHWRTGPFTLYSSAHQDWCGFYGEDPKRTIVQDIGTSAGPLVTVGSSSMSTYAGYLRFANITFQANGTSGSAFRAYDLAWTTFENCVFQGGAVAFECFGGVNLQFLNCAFQYATTGLKITRFTRAGGGWPNNIKLVGGIAGSNTAAGIDFDYGRQLVLQGTQIEGNGTTLGNASHGGLLVGPNVGLETGTNASNAHPGVVVNSCWFEDNRGIADVSLTSGLNTLTDCLFWSQETKVTNNVRISGQKYILRGCDFAHTFSVSNPNIMETATVLQGNFIDMCEAPNITWSNVKTCLNRGTTTYAPNTTVAGTITAGEVVSRGLNLAPLWNALGGAAVPKPLILFGYDASNSSPNISFGRTMANNGTLVILQHTGTPDGKVRCPTVTSVTTTGFTASKDWIDPLSKGVENYGIYWVAIGQEA